MISNLAYGVGYAARLTSSVIHQTTDTLINNRSATKKCFQLGRSILDLKDVVTHGAVQAREFTHILGKFISFYHFCDAWTQVEFWITRPFSKEAIDWEGLRSNLKNANPCDHSSSSERNEAIDAIIASTRKQSTFLTRESVIKRLKNVSAELGISDVEIPDTLKIPVKSRSFSQYLSTFCFTIADWGGCALQLQKWGVASFEWVSKAVTAIGGTRILTGIAQVGLKSVLGTAAALGMAVTLAETTVKLIQSLIDNDYKHKRGELSTKWAATGLDLAATALPIFVTLTPLVTISLIGVAKLIGLVKVFVCS